MCVPSLRLFFNFAQFSTIFYFFLHLSILGPPVYNNLCVIISSSFYVQFYVLWYILYPKICFDQSIQSQSINQVSKSFNWQLSVLRFKCIFLSAFNSFHAPTLHPLLLPLNLTPLNPNQWCYLQNPILRQISSVHTLSAVSGIPRA